MQIILEFRAAKNTKPNTFKREEISKSLQIQISDQPISAMMCIGGFLSPTARRDRAKSSASTIPYPSSLDVRNPKPL